MKGQRRRKDLRVRGKHIDILLAFGVPDPIHAQRRGDRSRGGYYLLGALRGLKDNGKRMVAVGHDVSLWISNYGCEGKRRTVFHQ